MRTTRRSARIRLVLAGAIAASLVAVAAFRTQTVSACSIGSPLNVADSLDRSVATSQLFILGTVTNEREMARLGTVTYYESTVTPDVVLKGEVPAGPITIPWLGQLSGDCSGGPHLKKGERVLLPLYWADTARSGDGSIDYAWQLNGLYAKVLLQDGQAYAQGALGGEPLGDSDSTIRQLGAIAAADSAQIDLAIAAAHASSPASGSSNHRWQWSLAVVAALVLGGAVIVITRRRGRNGAESRDA